MVSNCCLTFTWHPILLSHIACTLSHCTWQQTIIYYNKTPYCDAFNYFSSLLFALYTQKQQQTTSTYTTCRHTSVQHTYTAHFVKIIKVILYISRSIEVYNRTMYISKVAPMHMMMILLLNSKYTNQPNTCCYDTKVFLFCISTRRHGRVCEKGEITFLLF